LPRYFVEIAYKGTRYHGWQTQPNAITVQEVVNRQLKCLLRDDLIETVGCGRTDTGVHASQFYFHVDTPQELNELQFCYRLNAMLPKDIVAYRFILVHADAHARFDASSRTYHYFMHTQRNPFIEETSLYYPHTLHIDKMNEAATLLLSYDDFGAFCKSKSNHFTTLCSVTQAEFIIKEKSITFVITANRFLRNMVRSLVGTLLMVGTEKITLDEFRAILESKDRNKSGKSIDGKGLFLSSVQYPYITENE
jgi:tRNA pseudouridine38-40 synthase